MKWEMYASAVVEPTPSNPVKEPPKQKYPDMINEPVIEKDTSEFMKFIKHSEYSVVEQLNKLQARIFLLTLLMNSSPIVKP